MTKLEVKVLAHPKPQIRWLKAGEEIIPSDEFQIENFDDGTSILIINDIYPDDSGEITFEAHNALGVAMTTTELVVEGTFRGQLTRETTRTSSSARRPLVGGDGSICKYALLKTLSSFLRL